MVQWSGRADRSERFKLGILQDDLRAAVKKGIAKVNVAQDLRLPYQNTIKDKNSVIAAQQVVYDRTALLIKEYFGIAGSSKVISTAGS